MISSRRTANTVALFTLLLTLLVPGRSGAWTKDCSQSGCRIYELTDVHFSGDSETVRVMLEVRDSGEILVVPLNSRRYHQRFWTTKPPTYLQLGGTDYVPSRFFFNERFGGGIAVDGEVVAGLDCESSGRLRYTEGDSSAVLEKFQAGNRASITYTHSLYGSGQKISFTLIGFTRSWNSLDRPKTAKPELQADPKDAVAKLIKGNRFRLTRGNLRVSSNPLGDGSFVFIPKRKYAGVDRLFLWFVKGTVVLKLNGATDAVTPQVPFPLDVSMDFWPGTGLSQETVVAESLRLAKP